MIFHRQSSFLRGVDFKLLIKSKSPFARPHLKTKTNFLDNHATHLRDTVSGPGSFGDPQTGFRDTHLCTVTRTYSRVQHTDRGHRHQLCPTRRCSWYKLYLHVFGPVVLCTIIIELSLHFLLRTPRFQNFDPGGSQVWSCNWDRLQLGQFKKIQTKFDSWEINWEIPCWILNFQVYPALDRRDRRPLSLLKELCTYGTRLGDLKENWFLLFSN